MQNATCIAAGTEANPPTSLSTNNISSSSATLTWIAVPSTTNYTVQYKLATASTWTSAGTTSGTSINLTSLSPGANYVWSVKSDCSPFSANASFTTTGSTGTTSRRTSTARTTSTATIPGSAMPISSWASRRPPRLLSRQRKGFGDQPDHR